MNLNKQKTTLIKAGYWFLVAGVVLLCLRYLAWYLLPFLLGFLIAWMLRPVAGFLQRNSGLNGRGASIIAALLFYLILAVILWALGWGMALGLQKLQAWLPMLFSETISPFLSSVGDKLGIWEQRLGAGAGAEQVAEMLEQAAGNVFERLSGWLVDYLGNIARMAPAFVIASLFTVLSSVLICADYKRVTNFVMNQIPVRFHGMLLEMRSFLTATLWKLLRAYLILMAITFFILVGGLWLLKIKGAWMIAAVIAVLDLLPILGSGLVLVPWGAGLLLAGNTFMGAGVLVLWAVLSIVRQMIEPRIVGNQIGLHPLVTLTAMYVGLCIAGFTGLLVAPVACLLLQHMQEKGIVKIFKKE